MLSAILTVVLGLAAVGIPDSFVSSRELLAATVTGYPLPRINPGPASITQGPDGNLWFTEFNGSAIGRITPGGAITEFFVTSGPPTDITTGPDGNLWFTEIYAGRIGRMTPAGDVNYYYVPTRNSWPAAITRGPDDNLWFTEVYANKIGRITPAGVIREFPVNGVNAVDLSSITAGPDGNLWFTMVDSYKVGKITPAGAITLYTTPTPDAQPSSITLGPDGNLWFIEDVGQIGRITTAGVITEYPIPGPPRDLGSAWISIAGGPDGNVWFTWSTENKIGRITPEGVVTLYTVPTPNAAPTGITKGPDGNLWFTELDGGKIGTITPDGLITEHTIPPTTAAPVAITAGPDGNLWFIEELGNRVGRITTDGAITRYVVPTANAVLQAIAKGPDGNIWFTEGFGNKIGRITPSGDIMEFTVPTENASPAGIVAGPDGNLWFTEEHVDKIGRITPSGAIIEFPLAPHRQPKGITVGADGNLWFTEDSGNRIGRITPAGNITEFQLANPDSAPNFGITRGPDGNVWFTEDNGNRIGRITPTGDITEYPVPTAAGLQGIAAGPDGNLWFTEGLGNKIGRITPTGVINEYELAIPNSGPIGITKGPDDNIWFTEAFANRIAKFIPSVPPTMLKVVVSGPGRVTSDPPGIACGADCSESYLAGTTVTLTANPDATGGGGTFAFVGWGGDCANSGIELTCSLMANGTNNASAAFSYAGAGSGYSRNYLQKAYVSYYGRPAEPEGLGYWADRMDREGQSLAAIIDAFGNSDEFNRRYGGLSNRALVTKIYQQLLGRDPDMGGLDWYVAELEAGRRTLKTITLDVLNGATTPPDSTVVANKLDVADYYTAKVAAGCGYAGEQTGVATLTPVTADPVTALAAKTAIDSRCAGESWATGFMLGGLEGYLSWALSFNQDQLQRNPQLAAVIQPKLDMLQSPTLAGEIRNGRYYVSTSAAASNGRWIPIAFVFPQGGLRGEAARNAEYVRASLPVLEGFTGLPFPADLVRAWFGFIVAERKGEGAMHMEEEASYVAGTGADRLPYEALYYHELSHFYFPHESLTQFLEVYAYNVIHTKSTAVPSWIYTHAPNYVAFKSDNGGVNALLDIYQLIGPDAMASAYRTIYPLAPEYMVDLSPQCQQAFVDAAPASAKAQVAAIAARIQR